ncbi:MAG: YdcH family protein [Alphaproteobacteria bacterium]|nr:YdcH family protein [Alphaproteobacteria bacterium]
MDRDQENNLRDELVALQQRHRALDEEIVELELSASVDQLTIKRLKKEKLVLKDRIHAIEDQLTPDIIA